jgi:uncharacterized membrane protein
MRAVYGLIAILLILGPVGMGILFNADAPLREEISTTTEDESSSLGTHGTRSPPPEVPTYVNLYFHEGLSMNTSTFHFIVPDAIPGDITFTLQDPLLGDLLVEDPIMKAQVYLAGTDTGLTVNVYNNEVGGTLVASGTYPAFNYKQIPTYASIELPFAVGIGDDYTFNAGNNIVIQFDFNVGTGIFHYDYSGRMSNLRMYCTPVTDITVSTYDFDNVLAGVFYPRNIDFPEERKKVRMKGTVTDVFADRDGKYIDHVQVVIRDPDGVNNTEDADWDKDTDKYSYTWNYDNGQKDGEYFITTHVFDQQDNEFTTSMTFNMSEYGVLLTSPSQEPEEGSYKSEAKRNVVENSITTYHINVYNIGNDATDMDITTSGLSGWDRWLLGGNFSSVNNVTKSGTIEDLAKGEHKGIKFTVDAMDNGIGMGATFVVTAKCAMKPSEDHSLTTVTTVVLDYDVELKFLDGSKLQKKTVEIGAEADYDFVVANKGGTFDTIYIDIGSTPSGWSKSLSGDELKSIENQYYVDLASGENTDLTLTLTAPGTGGDEIVLIDIIGTSKGSQDQGIPVSDRITTNTTKTKGLSLDLIGDDSQDWSPGDNRLTYTFELTNTGTTTADFTASFTPLSSSDGWSSNDISLDQENFQLDPGASDMIRLYVEPTIEVMAGDYSITVKAVNDDDQTRKEEWIVSCTIEEYYNIEVIEPPDLELYGKTEPGKDVEYEIRIKNNGNTAERVNINVIIPSDWELDFGNASNIWSEEMDPQDIETATIVLTPPDDAPGDETVDITVSVVPVQSDQIDILTHTEIKSLWYQPLIILLVPILLFIVVIVMVIVIYKRR